MLHVASRRFHLRFSNASCKRPRIDLVMGRLPNDKADEHIQLQVLFWESAFVVAGTKHELTRRRKIKLKDLMNEAWCLPPPQSFPGSLIGRAFQTAGLEVPRTCVSVHSVQMQNALLATGRFIAILPETMMNFSAQRLGLKRLPVDLPIERTPVAIVTLKDRELPPAIGSLSSVPGPLPQRWRNARKIEHRKGASRREHQPRRDGIATMTILPRQPALLLCASREAAVEDRCLAARPCRRRTGSAFRRANRPRSRYARRSRSGRPAP